MKSRSRTPGRRLLHSPGPTPVPDAVLHAMMLQPMDLADPRVSEAIDRCERGLKRLMDAEHAHVFLYASNGHGMWEAAIENLVQPRGAILVPATGHFSESWAIQAQALGREVIRTPWNPGYPIDIEAVARCLQDDTQHRIEAIFVVHTDTSSGVTSPLEAYAPLLQRLGHPALLVVDVVASLGAAPFSMRSIQADAVLGASQKGLMCPPGLGFLATNERAFEAAKRNPAPRYYWDCVKRLDDVSYRKFCGTAPQSLVQGLAVALDLIFEEGLEQVFERHRQLAHAVHAAVQAWSEAGPLRFFAQVPESRSVSVTTVTVPPQVDIERLRQVGRDRFQVAFAGALGPLTGKAFRIGHLGDHNPANLLGCLGGIEGALRSQGVAIGDQGLHQAVRSLDGYIPA